MLLKFKNMEKIYTYRTEIDKNLKNILVKEKSFSYETNIADSPGEIVRMMNNFFRMNKLAEEYVYMIALNTRCSVIGIFQISHGTVNEASCSPRDLMIKALLCGASGIIVLHNHPSERPDPSLEDIATMNKINEACNLIELRFMDSIIIGGNNYYSFKEHNMLKK